MGHKSDCLVPNRLGWSQCALTLSKHWLSIFLHRLGSVKTGAEVGETCPGRGIPLKQQPLSQVSLLRREAQAKQLLPLRTESPIRIRHSDYLQGTLNSLALAFR